jgi:hypothetical protein
VPPGPRRFSGWPRALLAALLGALSLAPAAAIPAAGQERPAPELIARNLAENILGEGTVRSVQVGPGGQRITITWDAVLYRPTHTRAKNREQLRGEAELATGAIMGVLKPHLITFRILLKERAIAQGTRSPENFIITYATDLNG